VIYKRFLVLRLFFDLRCLRRRVLPPNSVVDGLKHEGYGASGVLS